MVTTLSLMRENKILIPMCEVNGYDLGNIKH